MNAASILEAVAATYANLNSLAVDMVIANESDDGSLHEQPAKGYFVAPDKSRTERGSGQRGLVIVSDGQYLHHYFGGLAKRYSKNIFRPSEPLPGMFRPEIPITADATFLFNRIAERVSSAEFLRNESVREDDSESVSHVLLVSYEMTPVPHILSSSPLTVWVDSKTHLVSRVQGETKYTIPEHDETHTTKITLRITGASMDRPISREMFEFTPPPDAIDTSEPTGRGGGFVGVGGGGRSRRINSSGGQVLESWQSHNWAGSTLIERSKLNLNGVDLKFERRLTISEDRREVRLVERIDTPAGTTDREISLPLVPSEHQL